MNEKLAQALDHIDDRKIAEAAVARKKHRHLFLKAVAAVLLIVFALNFNLPIISMRVNAKMVSEASGPRAMKRPDRDDYDSYEEYAPVWDAYYDGLQQREARVATALTDLNSFFTQTTAAYMEGSDKNLVCSPINAYIALASLAEVTDGESRQQILTALNTPDLETLRSRTESLWENVYHKVGNEMSVLASSLWLDEGLNYNQQTMDDLSLYYYTSVYQKDLSSRGASKALATWIGNNTGGMLKSNTSCVEFPEVPVMTLVSTVYLQSKWSDQFSKSKNTEGLFHSPAGDTEVTFMNCRDQDYYFWTEDYGASYRWLKNGCRMWFFLPDPDKTVDDVLKDGNYLELLMPGEYGEQENSKYLYVNWTIPKFDVSSSADLSDSFKALGVTDVFSITDSDFTAITSDTPVYLTGVNQAARVIVDEEGVKAASYIEIPGAGAAQPPEDEVDMVLDRPFVFVITSTGGIPLFTGVVIEP